MILIKLLHSKISISAAGLSRSISTVPGCVHRRGSSITRSSFSIGLNFKYIIPIIKIGTNRFCSQQTMDHSHINSSSTSSSSTDAAVVQRLLPKLPTSNNTEYGNSLRENIEKDMTRLEDEITRYESVREGVFQTSKTLSKNTSKIQYLFRMAQHGEINAISEENRGLVTKILSQVDGDPNMKDGRISGSIERFTETRLLYHFFNYGLLATKEEMSPVTDEEYIAAVLGFAQEISRYITGRAQENDLQSIYLCRELLGQINEKMLEFDLRNGPIRRKYDGLKYALKSVEDIVFELSLVNPTDEMALLLTKPVSNASRSLADDELEGDGNANPTKKRKVLSASGGGAEGDSSSSSSSLSMIDKEGFDNIRKRMDAYDKRREEVIKISRDIQKLSKQAIFSVHRGDLSDATKKLDDAKKIAVEKVFPIIDELPTLRFGSFTASLEEWAEGALFVAWVKDNQILSPSSGPFTREKKSADGTSTISAPLIDHTEYIGALSDFTGEIGRVAVFKAANRDLETVKKVAETQSLVYYHLFECNSIAGGKYTKKVDAVQTNLKKVEDILYELSLLQKGGKALKRDPVAVMKEGDDKDEN